MNVFVVMRFRLDCVEKADEFMMSVALHVAPDHRATKNVEGGERRGRAIAFVVVGHGCSATALQR